VLSDGDEESFQKGLDKTTRVMYIKIATKETGTDSSLSPSSVGSGFLFLGLDFSLA
jgi:hypothetical protein